MYKIWLLTSIANGWLDNSIGSSSFLLVWCTIKEEEFVDGCRISGVCFVRRICKVENVFARRFRESFVTVAADVEVRFCLLEKKKALIFKLITTLL